MLRTWLLIFLAITSSTLISTSHASETNETEIASILLEARDTASTIKDSGERATALDFVVTAQTGMDLLGARNSLKLFPDLLNAPNHLASLAFRYAKVGDTQGAEEILTELFRVSGSEQMVRLSRANALGYVAWAYANVGKFEEANRRLAELKKQYEGENYAIVRDTTARIAEVQAEHGNVVQAVELAKSVAEDNPYPLMSIVGGLVRTNNMPQALTILSDLEEWLQQYAKQGIASAQQELGNLKEAQTTARAIKPGHAQASAFMTLANHYMKVQDKATARTLFQEAAAAASSTTNNWIRADILWRIAAGTATAGDSMSALKIARSIEKDGHKIFAIRDIVKAQAEQGAFKEAFNTTSLLRPPSSDDESRTETYVHALTEIFTQMVRANRTKEARETAARFDGLTSHRTQLYSAIAATQADLDDIHGASITLSYAESEKQRVARRKEMARLIGLLKQGQDSEELRQLRNLQDREYNTLPALEAMALAYARRASLTEASKIANDLDFHKRVGLYEEIGNTLMVSNRKTAALQWARALSSPADKAYALVGIARAIATSKQNGNPTK